MPRLESRQWAALSALSGACDAMVGEATVGVAEREKAPCSRSPMEAAGPRPVHGLDAC